MDIPLFVSSLSEIERQELKKYVKTQPDLEPTREFINKIEVSARLYRLLSENSYPGDVFEYVANINKTQFMRLEGAGHNSWNELQPLLIKNGNL